MNYLDWLRYWLPATLAWRLNRTAKMWKTTLFYPFHRDERTCEPSNKDVDK